MDEDDSRLTDEQARPLRVQGASVALSAGAGCGKTTVLTARFLKSLGGPASERRPLRSLVALTFTEKAASELRDRIRQRCHERLIGAPNEDVAHWRSILRGLEAAPVSTFHEYCTRLLRRHAPSAGIDPDFQVLDEAIAASVLDESLARCVRRWLADTNEDLIELAVEYSLPRVREALGELVKGQSPRDLAAWAGRSEDEVIAV
jgi:ATP-dependent helicase/nuclease subunit A